MLHRSVFLYVLCAIAVVVCVGLMGCPTSPEEMAEVGPMDPVAEEAPAEMPEGEAAAVPTDFEWTDTPTVEMIPSGPIHGMMNGEPFEAKTVRIEKGDEGTFKMQISNVAVEDDDPTGRITGEDAWQFIFTATEGETGEWTWAISEEKGDGSTEDVLYSYQQGEDRGSMSIARNWGAALQITDWAVMEPAEDADTLHPVLGNVKGKVALVMDEDEKSWAAGEFDAVYYEF